MNKEDARSSLMYTGSIVFSGEKLSEEEAKIAENLVSTFKQPVMLAAGSLVLKDGVTLITHTFTQTAGSVLVMDADTTLVANTEGITLTNLGISTDSLNTTKGVNIKATGKDKGVTLTGPLLLLDSSGNFYEQHSLHLPQEYALLNVTVGEGGSVVYTEVPHVPEESAPKHYGYQGKWEILWTPNTGTGNPTTAKLVWTKTGYLPNPERRGPLVPNSLWGVFFDMRAFQDVMESTSQVLHEGRILWSSGMVSVFQRRKHFCT
ncbi:polymorphic outer membrane protein middle domain-containing protein [Candidatus Chlamydia sanziniae]|uniref:polymorphic outer membrane protein middle domain-containing protein n=1 Tax=Candidatus Chlamydia sanziniae TaxID=1806891 RepID=UPI0009EF4248|nr:polymorphic outer membrane protein middle domain-containing protein [Candidatus Chlamydia sanziniae]